MDHRRDRQAEPEQERDDRLRSYALRCAVEGSNRHDDPALVTRKAAAFFQFLKGEPAA